MSAPLRPIVLLALTGLTACATSSVAGVEIAFEEADVSRAERAPDLLTRARSARDRALAAADAGDDAAAGDYATEARLWLQAALVEADRLELEEARLADEADEEALGQELAETRAERRARETEVGRERAAEVAREQMELAFAAAEARETRRPSPMDPVVAAGAFRTRARLLVAAAAALGAPVAEVNRLLEALEDTEGGRSGDRALREALGLHRKALELLGRSRSRSVVTAAVVGSLVEAATERGLDVSITPDGAFVTLGRNDESKMADLLRQFPHGPAKISGRGARRLASSLVRGAADAERLQIDESADPLSIQLPAYGSNGGLPAPTPAATERGSEPGV